MEYENLKIHITVLGNAQNADNCSSKTKSDKLLGLSLPPP